MSGAVTAQNDALPGGYERDARSEGTDALDDHRSGRDPELAPKTLDTPSPAAVETSRGEHAHARHHGALAERREDLGECGRPRAVDERGASPGAVLCATGERKRREHEHHRESGRVMHPSRACAH